MIGRLLKLPFRIASAAFSFVFVIGMLEFFGLMVYTLWRDEAALDELAAGPLDAAELLQFLLASPDRALLAVGLAVLGTIMVLTGETGSSHVHGGGDMGGGFDGGGGDGGGGGGGGGE